jgi:RNA polymerase sigma-70 factor (ECF subfamily)
MSGRLNGKNDSESAPSRALFKQFVEPELAILLRVARGLTRSKEDAEDLVQESLVRAFSALPAFDGLHPRAWLFTIMRNTHINMNRRNRPQLFDDGAILENYPPAFNATEILSAEQMAINQNFSSDLIRAFQKLDQRHREVLYLVDVEGFSYEECSSVLGISTGTVTSRLSRGRTKLRTYLKIAKAYEGFL